MRVLRWVVLLYLVTALVAWAGFTLAPPGTAVAHVFDEALTVLVVIAGMAAILAVIACIGLLQTVGSLVFTKHYTFEQAVKYAITHPWDSPW